MTPGGRAATPGVPSADRAGVVPDRWRGSRTAPAPAPGLPAAPTARSGCGSDQPGERRLRLRSPPNRPCQESAPFYGADS